MDIRVSITERKIMRRTYYVVTAGRTTLFFFEINFLGMWTFRLPGGRSLASFGSEAFPRKYFDDLCRATYFVEFGVGEFPERVLLHKGKKYIENKN